MGGGNFTQEAWDSFSQTNQTKSRGKQNFEKSARPDFLPVNIKKPRQSCETKEKPVVTPIIIALDVTGSMHDIPVHLIQGGLGTLMEKLLAQESIPNPHVMFMAVGDVEFDRSPLQVTQFEADIRIAEQLKSLWLEGGGGSNLWESYPLAWYFAATRTKLDSLKHGDKGIIFTLGDEHAPTKIDAYHLQKFLGEEQAQTWTTDDILKKAKESYDVFHLGITQGSNYTQKVAEQWQGLLAQHYIPVNDYTKVADVIVSTIVRLLEERKVIKDSVRQHLASRSAALLNMGGIGRINSNQADPSIPLHEPPAYGEEQQPQSPRMA